ncbi:ankyrin repeat domain-containing protein [Paenibacillus sp. GCM10023252]|uniref:ankyrin repeat domain-containing protein n=1 Tax=Paenibacillus sp. GCM10023252 TaxID=3252649 RepID=UPI00361F3C48
MKIILITLTALILMSSCQSNTDKDVKTMPTINRSQELTFIRAAEEGDLAAVQQGIEQGIAIDAQDNRGRTAMLAATHGDYPDVVKVLLDAGANMHLQDDLQDNPFLYAGAEGLHAILKLLIQAGPDLSIVNRYGGNALIPAAEKGHVDNVRLLLEETDIDVNHVNRLGWTALLEAIILSRSGSAQEQIIQLLLDHDADVTLADNKGVTPLQHAKSMRLTKVVQMLRDAGAAQ